jgi:hypothetical protein
MTADGTGTTGEGTGSAAEAAGSDAVPAGSAAEASGPAAEAAGPATDSAGEVSGSAAEPAPDPWLALDEPGASPARVDALAWERLGRFADDDVRRSAGLTSWLVRRAAVDGSTTLDGTAWAAALRGYGIDAPRPGLDAAATAGRVVALPAERAIAHPRWGPLEGRIADSLRRLLERQAGSTAPDAEAPDAEAPDAEAAELAGDALPGGDAPDDALAGALAPPVCAVLAGVDAALDEWIGRLQRHANDTDRSLTVIEEAHRLDLASAAELLVRHENTVAEGLVLVGDPDELDPASPGRFFGDLVDSGAVPTIRLPGAAERGAIPRLVGSLRAGELPPVEPGQHDVVVSPVADAAQTVARVVELVTGALPRVLGVGPSDLLTLGIRRTGAAGVDALREAVGSGCDVAAVHEAVGRRVDAVVLVLPAESAGSLTRAHLISAASTARRHLSIVHQAGPALATAVRSRPRRPRRTRLVGLLRT